MERFQEILNLIAASRETYAAVFLAVSRHLVPALGAWLLLPLGFLVKNAKVLASSCMACRTMAA